MRQIRFSLSGYVMRADACRRFAVNLSLALLLIGLTGCSSGPKVVKVTGTVQHNGKPLSNVQLRFAPEAGGRASTGTSDENGRFELDYAMNVNKQKIEKGALQGMHHVSVKFVPRTPVEEMKGYKQPPDAHEILEKYGDKEKSPLHIEIKDDGQDVTVDLD